MVVMVVIVDCDGSVHAERHVASAVQKLQLGIWQLDTGQLKTGEMEKLCKTNCCGLDQEGPLKRAEVRELFSSDACVSKTWIIATIYALLYS